MINLAKDTAVNIGLHIQGRVVDLRVPRDVTKPHLKRVIAEALQVMKISVLPNFDLKFIDKPIEMNDTSMLGEYAVGNGDQLIMEATTHANI